MSKYGDAVATGLCELLTLAVETGGRWNSTAVDLVDKLALHKSQHVSPLLRRSVQLAWADRWASMLGMAVQDALASSLLAASGHRLVLDQSAAPAPELDLLLDGQRWAFEEPAICPIPIDFP